MPVFMHVSLFVGCQRLPKARLAFGIRTPLHLPDTYRMCLVQARFEQGEGWVNVRRAEPAEPDVDDACGIHDDAGRRQVDDRVGCCRCVLLLLRERGFVINNKRPP